MFLAGAPIFFTAQTQRIPAQSTSEAELIATNNTAKQGVYFSSMMGELGWESLRTFLLLVDNRSVLSLAATGNFSSRSRHIAVRYAAIRSWVDDGTIKLDYVGTNNMLADICTKYLYCVRKVQDSLIWQIANFK